MIFAGTVKVRSADFRADAGRGLALLVPGGANAFARVDESSMVGAAIAALMGRN